MTLTIAFAALASITAGAAQDTARYTIRFPAGEPLQPVIQASVPLDAGRVLRTTRYGAWSFPRGYGEFIQDLRATDCNDGRDLAVFATGDTTWTLGADVPGRVCISYRVDMRPIVTGSWPNGPRTNSAASADRAVVSTGGPLFITGDTTVANVVSIESPSSWGVLTPWQPDGMSRFRVTDHEALTRNALAWGNLTARTVRAGSMAVHVVFLGPMGAGADVVPPVVERVLTALQQEFGSQQRPPYVMAWVTDGAWESGESMENSQIIVSPNVPHDGDQLVWSNSIAHEFFHLWNGKRLAYAEWAPTQWFSEGATEYIANLTAHRLGLISEAQLLSFMTKHANLYTSFRFRWGTPYERLSLAAAGDQKSEYNAAVYDGGWMAAFCLDGLMREASQGQVGVRELLQNLLSSPVAAPGVTTDELFRRAEALSGADLGAFRSSYIDGTRMLPQQACFTRMGFRAVITPYVSHVEVDPSPTHAGQRARAAILPGSEL